MNAVIHALTTLWVYFRREHYLDQLLLEDDRLAMAEKSASGTTLARLRARRGALTRDMNALIAPLHWRSLLSARTEATALRQQQPASATAEPTRFAQAIARIFEAA